MIEIDKSLFEVRGMSIPAILADEEWQKDAAEKLNCSISSISLLTSYKLKLLRNKYSLVGVLTYEAAMPLGSR